MHPSKVLAKQEFGLLANGGGCLEPKRTDFDYLRVLGHLTVFV